MVENGRHIESGQQDSAMKPLQYSLRNCQANYDVQSASSYEERRDKRRGGGEDNVNKKEEKMQ